VYREDKWQRDYVRSVKARAAYAMVVAQRASRAVSSAHQVLDNAVGAVLGAKEKTAAACDRLCKTNGAAVNGWPRPPRGGPRARTRPG
jgi:hypothetical protein